MPRILKSSIVGSALWAAYGDSLGFPTELISADDFRRRSRGLNKIERPIEWSKRIGGLFGPEVTFPAGAYSDDTELRLCSSRAIMAGGYFDVESFSKVELPVWLSYAQGAGRGSKAAASNLALRDSRWSQNFFKTSDVKYWECGGNGAAMRIQPHVWKLHAQSEPKFFGDVVRDAVCTHGHPRGIVGAAIHALFVHEAMRSGVVPHPDAWAEIGEFAASHALQALLADEELALVWVPSWEQFAGRSLRTAWAQTTNEWVDAATSARSRCTATSKSPDESYHVILNEQGGFLSAERGSGLKTPLFAAAAAWLFRQESPDAGLRAAANAFGSDTDSIGTMAGAIVGHVTSESPPGAIQDADYIAMEAERIFAIGNGQRPGNFEYPDLMSWTAPRAQSDAWTSDENGAFLLGLGQLDVLGEPFLSRKSGDVVWQWAKLPFGQTILAKRRGAKDDAQRQLALADDPESEPLSKRAAKTVAPPKAETKDLATIRHELTLDEATQECIRADFHPLVVGEHLLSFCSGKDGVEKAIAFAAILSKARLARSRRA